MLFSRYLTYMALYNTVRFGITKATRLIVYIHSITWFTMFPHSLQKWTVHMSSAFENAPKRFVMLKATCLV